MARDLLLPTARHGRSGGRHEHSEGQVRRGLAPARPACGERRSAGAAGHRLSTLTPAESLGAFVAGPQVERPPTGSGALDGLVFAVKDLIDVEGVVTGGGNPDWAAHQRPATASAPVVATLLAAGAGLWGKTITDELAFSLEGENAHYGTPLNPRAPDRLPGGSSSGSASAVAGGAVDFALGTDTGGSVRVPAAFCGLFGIRPTHGALSLQGVIPFAPSFDTVGWFARDGATLARVGAVLLPGTSAPAAPRFLIAADAFALAEEPVAQALYAEFPEAMQAARRVDVFDGAADDWREVYRVLQGWEIWQSLGPWITRTSPRFGPAIAPRFAEASTITLDEVAKWRPWRVAARRHLESLLGADGVLVVPTAPSIAPRKGASGDAIGAFYRAALALTALAGHAGLPQITLPLTRVDAAPVGLSLIGPAGADRALLDLARGHSGYRG